MDGGGGDTVRLPTAQSETVHILSAQPETVHVPSAQPETVHIRQSSQRLFMSRVPSHGLFTSRVPSQRLFRSRQRRLTPRLSACVLQRRLVVPSSQRDTKPLSMAFIWTVSFWNDRRNSTHFQKLLKIQFFH
ncbi:hypothetical protein F2P79_023886 [Pimephales promelas]|nr:hypothetical protein F2P79_023886 [Pimephales promelas]